MSTRYQLPPTHCLLAFEARARLGTGVLAARELCITPSALSHRIKQLETLIGTPLFAKTEGDLILTAKGHEYLGAVREALGVLSHLSDGAAQRVQRRRRIQVCAPPTFATQILVPRLDRIREAFPDVDLELHLSVPLVGLKAEHADVEIRFGNGVYPGFNAVSILEEQVFPVCSPAYARAHGPFMEPIDILKGSLLQCIIEPWQPWFRAASLQFPEPCSAIQFVDIGLVVEAAACHQGIALARQSMIVNYLSAGRLVRLFDLEAVPAYAYYATATPEALARPQVSAFIAWLQANLQHDPPERLLTAINTESQPVAQRRVPRIAR